MEPAVLASSIDTVLLILFLVLFIIFIYFSITLMHHWGLYSFNVQFKRIASGIYFFFSVIILMALLFFIGLYIMDYGIQA